MSEVDRIKEEKIMVNLVEGGEFGEILYKRVSVLSEGLKVV